MSEDVKTTEEKPTIPIGTTFIFCEGGCGRPMHVHPDAWEVDAGAIVQMASVNPGGALPRPLCYDCMNRIKAEQSSAPMQWGEVEEGAVVQIDRGRELPVPAGLLHDFAAIIAVDVAPVENLLTGQHDGEPTKVVELPLYLIIALLRCLKEGDK